MELMLQPLRKYADFNGRARRSEYWLFQLFFWAVIVAFYIVAAVLSAVFIQPAATGPDGTIDPNDPAVTGAATGSMIMVGLVVLFFLAMIIPQLALRIRRLHDIGLSGWFVLIALVPGLGGLALFVMSVLDGNYGSNEFGPDPKGRGQKALAETFS